MELSQSTPVAVSSSHIAVDTTSWVLRRDDERRFSQKSLGAGASVFTPIGQRKKITVSPKQGAVALRQIMMESL